MDEIKNKICECCGERKAVSYIIRGGAWWNNLGMKEYRCDECMKSHDEYETTRAAERRFGA